MRVKSYIKLLMVAMLLTVSTGCSGKSTVEDSGNKNTDTYIREETEYFRSIMVADYKGTVDITRSEGDLVSAYEGLSLSDGDDVKVMDHSDLTLNVDSDKHLYADANTHFWLIASGTDGNTKTKIKLEEGSVLCQIKNKLLDNESFEIETPSSTMSVRGTVFRVSLIKGVKDDEVYELVEVFNGGVSTVIEVDGQSVELQPGECALIKEKEDGSEARFVLDDEIDEVFWKSDSMEFDIETEGGEGTPILKISYEKLTEMVLNSLMEISESGQELSVETEVLEQVKETGHNYEEVSRVEPSCVKEGTVVRRCSICGGEMSESIPLVSHNYVLVSQTAADCNSTGLIVRRCTMCNDEAVETVAMTSHDYVQLARVESTCTKEGYISYKCSICGDVKREAIAKTEHKYELSERKESTCAEEGYVIYKCSICKDTKKEAIAKAEHKYELSERKEPTCTADGYIIYKCSVCGDTKIEVLEKLGHDYKATGEVIEATCTEHSKIEEKCTRCNDSRYVVDNDSELEPHDYIVEESLATCTDNGYKVYTCRNCKYSYKEDTKAALGHNYEATSNKKSATCDDYGKTEEKCSRCDSVREVNNIYDPPLGHSFVVDSKTVIDPTCTKEGQQTLICIRENCDYSEKETLPASHNMTVTGLELVTAQPLNTDDGSDEADVTAPTLVTYEDLFTMENNTATVAFPVIVLKTCQASDCKHSENVEDIAFASYDSNDNNVEFYDFKLNSLTLSKDEQANAFGILDQLNDVYKNQLLDEIAKLFNKCLYSHNTISDLGWHLNDNDAVELDYVREVNFIIFHNVTLMCEHCGGTITNNEILAQVIKYNNLDELSKLTYTVDIGNSTVLSFNCPLTAGAKTALENYFSHEYVHVVDDVTVLKETEITSTQKEVVSKIKYHCGYHDCIYLDHLPYTTEETTAVVTKDGTIDWGDNQVENEKEVNNSLISQLQSFFEALFSHNHDYRYTMDRDSIKLISIRRQFGTIKVIYSFDVNKACKDDGFGYSLPVFAVRSEGNDSWIMTGNFNADEISGDLPYLNQRFESDVANYKARQ